METKERGEMTFLGHLEELRGHLVRGAISVGVFAALAFANKDFLFSKIILAPKETYFFTNKLFCSLADKWSLPALCINSKPVELINIDLAGQFTTHVVVSLMVGFIVASPYIIWEIWRFIKPGLTEKERASSRGAILVISGLFLIGVFFAYFLIAPLAINFLGNYQVSALVENQIALRSFVSTVSMLMLASGLVFELPVFVYFLSKVGVLTPSIMKRQRRLAIVLIFVISAIITPPDVFSQILIAIPLIILYEISIGISARLERKALAKS